MNIHETKKLAAVGFFAASLFGLTATPFAAPAAPSSPEPAILLPRADGSWFVRTSTEGGALRYVQVTSRGEKLDEVTFTQVLGEPVAAAADDARALWFRESDPVSGEDWLRLRDEAGAMLREWEIPVFPVVNGAPTGKVHIDLSPSGGWAVLRTIPVSGAAQIEWWNLSSGHRFPVLARDSSFEPEVRSETLARAEVHPGWDWAFTLSAPKPRFSDVLSELASPCTSSTAFALPDGDRVLEALPTGSGLGFFVVERPVTETNDGRIEPLAVPGRRILARRFLVLVLDEAGHILREEPLGETTEGLDLSRAAISISRSGESLVATDGSGILEVFDLVVGKRDRFALLPDHEDLGRVDDPAR